MAQNCWKNCTPVETGLCLALIVSVTFLIIMIIVYLFAQGYVSDLFSSRYYQCSKACACIDQFSRLLFFPIRRPEGHIPEAYSGESRLHESVCLGKNYNIAAILKQNYVDDLKSFEYLCPAAILSFKWLVSQNCIGRSTTNVYAAIGTKYWSKSGYLHSVERTVKIMDALIMLKLEVGIIIKIDFVQLVGNFKTNSFFVTTWNETLKHQKAIERDLQIVDDVFCEDGTFCATQIGELEFNLKWSFAISNENLYGFYNDTVCSEGDCVHRFISMKPYISYIRNVS